ncbi:hypothetical protein FRB99_008391, partial [Tulasnella sp. 403]
FSRHGELGAKHPSNTDPVQQRQNPLMTPPTTTSAINAEKELASALATLKPHLLKRSWISFPKKHSEIGLGGFGSVHRGTLQKVVLFSVKTDVAVKKLYTKGDWDER